jgi:hypothetical protein
MQPKYRIKCSSEWNKSQTRQFAIRFSVGKDDAIISKLDSVPNKTDYVRRLVSSDLKRKKQ